MKTCVLSTLMVVLMASSVANAGVIYTNLGPGGTYSTDTFNVVRGATADPPFGSADQANAFTVGATDYTFASALLALDFCGGGILQGCTGTNQIDILLLSNTSNNLPGTVLQTIPLSNIPDIGYPTSGTLLVMANAVAPLTLHANTAYWLGATVLAPDSYFAWLVNNTGDQIFAFRPDGGAWVPGVQHAASAAFQIIGNPTPEPSSLTMLLIAVLAGWLLLRNREPQKS